MTYDYVIIRPGDTRESDADTVQWPRDPGLGRLHTLIDPILGDVHFEHVYVLHQGKQADMFVDENGLAKRLPRNELATTLYRAAWLRAEPDLDPESLTFIAGTAVLFKPTVWR